MVDFEQHQAVDVLGDALSAAVLPFGGEAHLRQSDREQVDVAACVAAVVGARVIEIDHFNGRQVFL